MSQAAQQQVTQNRTAQSLAALNEEWRWLADRHSATVARWRRHHRSLAACSDLDDVLGAIRADPDPVLGVLVERTARGEMIAGRTVLQALLGKLVLMARADPAAELADYVSQAWLRIHDYPLERRPRRIAANITLDTLKAVRRDRPKGLVMLPEETLEALAGSAEAPAEECWSARRVVRSASDLGLIDAATAGVLTSVYADGLSGRDAARRHATSPDMIRWRCSRGVRRIAAHADALAAAA